MTDRFTNLIDDVNIYRELTTDGATGAHTECDVTASIVLKGVKFTSYAFADVVDLSRFGTEEYWMELEDIAITELFDKLRNTHEALQP